MKRIAVFGGRDYHDWNSVWRALEAVRRKSGAVRLVHGACPTGADRAAQVWAWLYGVEQEEHPARWAEHGRAAGPIRNRTMARSGLQGAVGFPGGQGTKNMASELAEADVPVWWPCGGQPDGQ